MNKELKYSERTTFSPPFIKGKSGAATNDYPSVLWDRFIEEDAILETLPKQWFAIFPVGNYIPEDSNDTHIMLSPNITDKFSSIQTLSDQDLLPVATILLRFIKEAGPDGYAGYNTGIDRTRSTPQTWDNFHIHLVARESLEYVVVKNERHLPIKLREPASQHISSLAELVFLQYQGDGIDKILKPADGPFHGFPVSGSLVSLKDSTTPDQLITLLKHIDNSYSNLHKEFFSAFVENYENTVESLGKVLYQFQDRNQILTNLDSIKNRFIDRPDMDKVIRYLAKLARYGLREWDQTIKDTEKKVISAPSYSISLAHREGKDYLVFAPHFFRQAGSQDVLGTLTPREYKEGSSFLQRKERGKILAKKIKTYLNE